MVHIHHGILLSHKKNTFELVLIRWMNLEPVIQRSESERENKDHILMHIYGIYEDGADDPMCRAAMEMQR